jgi:hypothetical protein
VLDSEKNEDFRNYIAVTDLGVPEWVQRRPTQLAKDKKVAIHERALLLTHSSVVERHVRYLTTNAEKRARTKARSAGASGSSSAALTTTTTADQGAEPEMAQAESLLVTCVCELMSWTMTICVF